jgi:hypothetical protein
VRPPFLQIAVTETEKSLGESTLHLLLWADVTVVSTLSLAAVDCVGWESGITLSANHLFAFVGSGQSSEGWLDLDASETTSTKSQNEMKGGLLLDVIVRESTAIFELLSSEDKSLLIRWNTFLVLDLGLDVLNGVSRLDIQSDRLSREGLDENLHGTTTETEDKMERGFLLNVVIRQSSAIFKLLSGEDESLLIWGNTFFVLNLGFDVFNSIGGLHI